MIRFEKELAEISRVKGDVPMTPGAYLSLKDCPEPNSSEAIEAAKLPCRELLGVLLWVTMTRPDISFVMGHLCRHMIDPNMECYRCALNVLIYLHKTQDLCIRLLRWQLRSTSTTRARAVRAPSDASLEGVPVAGQRAQAGAGTPHMGPV